MRRAERGHVLLFALLVVVLMTTAVSLVAIVLGERQKVLDRETRAVVLTALADAALARTLAELAANPRFEGVGRHAFAQGEIESEVEQVSPSAAEIVVRATYRGQLRTAHAQVRRTSRGPRVVRWWVERPAGRRP